MPFNSDLSALAGQGVHVRLMLARDVPGITYPDFPTAAFHSIVRDGHLYFAITIRDVDGKAVSAIFDDDTFNRFAHIIGAELERINAIHRETPFGNCG